MNKNDEKLRGLLRQWRDIEPAVNFETNVRRRIRLTAPEPRQSWLIGLVWRPAFATAVAAVLSVIIGTSAGILTSRRADQSHAEMRFMSAGTLAGGYACLITETRR